MSKNQNSRNSWCQIVRGTICSLKVGEPLKEHLKRKRPNSRSKSSNDRSNDEERSLSPKRGSKKSKKQLRSRSKKKHGRYSSSSSPSSSSNEDSDESKYRNSEGKESTDSRLRWFLRRISTNTAYLKIWSNTPTLILILTSKRQT